MLDHLVDDGGQHGADVCQHGEAQRDAHNGVDHAEAPASPCLRGDVTIPDGGQDRRGEEHGADKVPVGREVLLHNVDPGVHCVCEDGLVVCEQAGEGLDTNKLGINPITLL